MSPSVIEIRGFVKAIHLTAVASSSETVVGQVPVERVEQFVRLDRPGEVAQCVAIQLWHVLEDTSIDVINSDDLIQNRDTASRKGVFDEVVPKRTSCKADRLVPNWQFGGLRKADNAQAHHQRCMEEEIPIDRH